MHFVQLISTLFLILLLFSLFLFHSSSKQIIEHRRPIVSMRQIDLTGLLLQTIYQIGSLLKVFMQGVSFFMHSTMHAGDTAEPPLALAR